MATTVYSSALGEETFARMRWSAVFAGWFVATGIAILLYGAGIALGFSAFDPHNAQAAAKGLGVGTIIWMVLVWAASLFIGGLFSSWFDGRADDTMGSLHGITVWGLAITASALWLAITIGQMSHEHERQRDGGTPSGMSMEAVHNEPLAVLRTDVHRTLTTQRDTRGDSHADKDAEQALIGALLAGHVDTARAILIAQTEMSSDAATARVTTWLPVVNAASDTMRADADHIKQYAAAGMWALFLSGLVGLIAAALGGWMGSRHIHRIYHLRRYEGRPFRG
ncbi:hypothetical protein [Dyella sp. C11]|uniref:hypothetical protein n=1 Tax=Dyella sp. C11 TaxID=2126991 RepID=UPI000D65727B|nr:hypothetical protein [Dyella sp. C11]